MPKAPILTRTCVFVPTPRGTYRRYEWNIVTTSLGTMLEPVSQIRGNGSGLPSGMQNEDVYETDFTDVKIMTLDELARFGAAGGLGGGNSLPRTYSAA